LLPPIISADHNFLKRRSKMKSWLTWALVLATGCLSMSRIAVAQQNILVNGDFEADAEGTMGGGTDVIDVTSITGWRIFGVGGATGTATVTSAAGRSGKGIELVRADPPGADSALDKDDPALRSVIPAEERIYKLTVDARDGGAFSASPALTAELQFVNSAVNRGAAYDPGAAFETFGLTARSDDGGSISARFSLPPGGDHSVHLDNATLIDATSGVNRMLNGGFENSAASLINWRFFDTTGVSGTAALSSDAHSGASAARLSVTMDPAGGDIGLDLEPGRIGTIGGEQLSLSFAAKTVEAPTADTRLKVGVAGFDVTGLYTGEILGELVSPGTTAYESFSFMFDVPTDVHTINVGFRVFDQTLNVNTPGTYLIDDVSVLRAAETNPADLDQDFDVDGTDFLLIQRGLGSTTTAADLANWKSSFGATMFAAPVPEPATATMVTVALSVCSALRRNRSPGRLRAG